MKYKRPRGLSRPSMARILRANRALDFLERGGFVVTYWVYDTIKLTARSLPPDGAPRLELYDAILSGRPRVERVQNPEVALANRP